MFLAATGGGARLVELIGGIIAGVEAKKLPVDGRGRFKAHHFDALLGDSSGSLAMAFLANGANVQAMRDLIVDTNFKKYFSPFLPMGLRLELGVLKEIPLDKLARWIDTLGFSPANARNLFVNAWDIQLNRHVIYCETRPSWALDDDVFDSIWVERAFSQLGYGTVLTRSMALPTLRADDGKSVDGGCAGHPPLFLLPRDMPGYLLNLGFAGLVPEKGTPKYKALDKALECFDVASSGFQTLRKREFAHLHEIRPSGYQLSSTKFDMSPVEMARWIDDAKLRSRPQWDVLPTLL